VIDWNAVARRVGFQDEKALWTELYLARELSISEIAIRFGVSHAAIRMCLIRCEIPVRKRGGPRRHSDPFWPSDEALRDEVVRTGYEATAKRLGFSRSAIYKRLKYRFPDFRLRARS